MILHGGQQRRPIDEGIKAMAAQLKVVGNGWG